ncbi:hypothetical protein [Reinekea blandensis]|uniref:Uncharacterized protein n=1 Tax=Reinekea blandensis MED297 TaxID=314283 RepID=A4BG54_9GAMM|nr:hypothetical protein [Reinekea blandensis]EAR08849.1 hypothetical protein MED297_04247 [Reinekea sp. MED297] [Reinekea blandensis MED297]
MNALTIWRLIQTKQSTSPNRLWKDTGLALAILTALMFLGQFGDPTNDHQTFGAFGFAMIIMAIIELGGHTFSEFKRERFAFQWLTLPASVTEKWLANFVTSFLLVPLIFLVVLSVSTMIANLLILLSGWTQPMPIFNPISAEGWTSLKAYWIVHPLLFFGTTYFRKRPVLKTLGASAILLIALALYAAWLANLLFGDAFPQIEQMGEQAASEEEFLRMMTLHFDLSNLFATLRVIGDIACYLYFLFFWGLSYLRFTEWEL